MYLIVFHCVYYIYIFYFYYFGLGVVFQTTTRVMQNISHRKMASRGNGGCRRMRFCLFNCPRLGCTGRPTGVLICWQANNQAICGRRDMDHHQSRVLSMLSYTILGYFSSENSIILLLPLLLLLTVSPSFSIPLFFPLLYEHTYACTITYAYKYIVHLLMFNHSVVYCFVNILYSFCSNFRI